MTQFQIHKSDPTRTRVVDASGDETQVDAGEALIGVQHFGFSANNVTYAVMGDQMRYWEFFPALDDAAGEWGVVPVWGFGEVVSSRSPVLEVGDRLFGYFPTADHLLMRPHATEQGAVVDSAPHRAELPAAYNSYQRVEGGGDLAAEDRRMLLYPLYLTSWAIDAMLADDAWSGAEQVVVTSASSKTAIGLAYAIRAGSSSASSSGDGPTVVGLTSSRNRALVESLGLYDRVVVYEEVESGIDSVPTVIVDMAGDGGVLGGLHRQLGERMRRSVAVGLTHWEERGGNADIIAERSELFFAPSVIGTRIKEWGAEEFNRRIEEFLGQALAESRDWLRIEETRGVGGMAAVYDAVRAGSVAADVGLVVRTGR